MAHLPYTADRRARRNLLFADPETIDVICAHVANGSDLPSLCATWDLPFGWISNWIHADMAVGGRHSRYIQALNDRSEWVVESVLAELRKIGFSDLRQLFAADGSLLPPKDWPQHAAASVASVEVDELFEGTGQAREQVGVTRKVKLWDKMRALEMIGKNLSMFIERHEVTGHVTLEDLVNKANEREVIVDVEETKPNLRIGSPQEPGDGGGDSSPYSPEPNSPPATESNDGPDPAASLYAETEPKGEIECPSKKVSRRKRSAPTSPPKSEPAGP